MKRDHSIKFKKAIAECRQLAESTLNIRLPARVSFDVTKVIFSSVERPRALFSQKFLIGSHDGSFESFTPVCRALWMGGLPPKTVYLKVTQVRYCNTIIQIEISPEFITSEKCTNYEISPPESEKF